MYCRQDRKQAEFEDFYLPFGGRLRSDNRWVRLAKLIPWDEIEQRYAKQFDDAIGAPALSARIAVGSLIIKERQKLTNEETVEQIRENPYLQYFLGYEAYRDEAPFDPSMMVHFRKRASASMVIEISELTVEKHQEKRKKRSQEDDLGEGDGPDSAGKEDSGEEQNRGQLLMDASCAPADIRHPTDLSLLNEAREKTESIIDTLHEPDVGRQEKPRTYRQEARKKYLAVAKKRKPGKKKIRKAIGQQLRYLRRNLRYINEYAEAGRLSLLSRWEYRNLLVCAEVYRQQDEMYRNKTHSMPGRIVSISQPHVRPIYRGKASGSYEFGAKISISKIDGYAYLDRVSWEPYNETEDLIPRVEAYHERYGCYPKSVHVDAIYRTRENRKYCKAHGIRISGPPLGRPKLHPKAEEKRQALADERKRVEIEGGLGRGKRRYSLARIMAKLAETSESTIAMVFLVMNLDTLLRDSFCRVFRLVVHGIYRLFERLRSGIATMFRPALLL